MAELKKTAAEKKDTRVTYICGHKNPDTDSVCSAISYAWLKNHTEDREFVACRAGELNNESRFVLDHFHVEAPKRISSVKTQLKDIAYRHTEGIKKDISIKTAWKLMQDWNVVTLPSVNDQGKLEGLITVGDIATSYMDVYDSAVMSKANTRYSNIIDTLEGLLVVGSPDAYFDSGKVLVSAANPEMMEYYIAKGDLVILGNRYESQLCAIEQGAACLVICEGANITQSLKKLATEHGTTVIITAYDACTAARLINQSIPISYFMKRDNLVTFGYEDYLDDIRDIMASVRHRDFPVLDHGGRYLGMISRRNLLGAQGKRMILVDHNEKNQAVDGIEEADVVEIIDHHRLGTIETISPVYFRGQPLGCTGTIIYEMFQEQKVEIPKEIAGLLCSAIISDTLLFRSPTCTPRDQAAGTELAALAGLDIREYALKMFAAGSDLHGKTSDEIFHQDYKKFTAGKMTIGVGQVSSMNGEELNGLKKSMLSYMQEAVKSGDVDMMYLMLTNIFEENTSLLCAGDGAEQLVAEAFHLDAELAVKEKTGIVELPGVVSRKKQLIPALMMGVQS